MSPLCGRRVGPGEKKRGWAVFCAALTPRDQFKTHFLSAPPSVLGIHWQPRRNRRVDGRGGKNVGKKIRFISRRGVEPNDKKRRLECDDIIGCGTPFHEL